MVVDGEGMKVVKERGEKEEEGEMFVFYVRGDYGR